MSENAAQTMDIARIMSLLPHRYPFLLVDRVVECVPGDHIIAYKNVSINEPFFQGHFPGAPVMPGVLILEALAQAGGLLALSDSKEDYSNKLFLFTGLEGVKLCPATGLSCTAPTSAAECSCARWTQRPLWTASLRLRPRFPQP